MSEGAVAIRDPLSPALPSGGEVVEGLGVSDADLGIRPPILKIVTENDGCYRIGKTGTPYKTLDAVLLRVTKMRALRSDPREWTSPLLCASDNGIVPLADVPEPKSKTCRTCDYAQWGERSPLTGKGTPPPCQDTYVLLLLLHLPEEEKSTRVVFFLATKSKIAAVRELLASMRMDVGVKALWECKLSLGLQPNRNGAVTYYTPLFTITEHHAEWREQYRPIVEKYAGASYTPVATFDTTEDTPEEAPPF